MGEKYSRRILKIVGWLTAGLALLIGGLLTQVGKNLGDLPFRSTDPPAEETPDSTKIGSSLEPPVKQSPSGTTPSEASSQLPEGLNVAAQKMIGFTLVLDSNAASTIVSIDGEPAPIHEQGLTTLKIKAPVGPHLFTLDRQDGYSCSFNQVVDRSTTSISPKCNWEKRQ